MQLKVPFELWVYDAVEFMQLGGILSIYLDDYSEKKKGQQDSVAQHQADGVLGFGLV